MRIGLLIIVGILTTALVINPGWTIAALWIGGFFLFVGMVSLCDPKIDYPEGGYEDRT